jgi:hypothetical protein
MSHKSVSDSTDPTVSLRVRCAKCEGTEADGKATLKSSSNAFAMHHDTLPPARGRHRRQNCLPKTWGPRDPSQCHTTPAVEIVFVSARRALTPFADTRRAELSSALPHSGTPPDPPLTHPNPIQPPLPPPHHHRSPRHPLTARIPSHVIPSRAAAHAASGSERFHRLAAEHVHEPHLLLRRTCSGLGLGLGLGLGSGVV